MRRCDDQPRASIPTVARTRGTITAAGIALLTLLACAFPRASHAMCAPFPPDGVFLTSSGQLNWVVMHRDRGEIQLIPNAHIVGEPSIFSLIVPTPALPALDAVPASLWTEAAALTAPAFRQSVRSESFGCGTETISEPVAAESDGVVVHEEKQVGAFLATIVSSDDPGALVQWLRDNQFAVTPEQESRIEPLTSDGWFFTAMKLDTTQVSLPPAGWDITVAPVSFTYEASELELPLGFLGINRAASTTMLFYVVDDHRTTLPGFQTGYANRISASEFRAIESAYPSVAPYVEDGRFLTKLSRTFGSQDAMIETLTLVRAGSDEEFRPTWGGGRFALGFAAGLPGHLLVLCGVVAALRRISRRQT